MYVKSYKSIVLVIFCGDAHMIRNRARQRDNVF